MAVSTCAPWATTADLCAPCTAATPGITTALAAASNILYKLSGRRYSGGSCTSTIRPCSQYRSSTPPAYGSRLLWPGVCSCNRSGPCGCTTWPEYEIQDYPVTSITSVKVDGVVLAAGKYRLDENRYLVFLDYPDGTEGAGLPCCQRVSRPDTEEETSSITYVHGVAPPPEGVLAAAQLGCELARACSGGDDCALSPRVTSLVRQGVSLEMLDPQMFLDKGRTGLYSVDLFLASSPNVSLTVWSPDADSPARRT